jgi:hypothetical protein
MKRIAVVRVLVVAGFILVLGCYSADTSSPGFSAFFRSYLLSERWMVACFVGLFVPAFVMALVSCRCPVCDSFTTGKGNNSNYCPTCKSRFDINNFR